MPTINARSRIMKPGAGTACWMGLLSRTSDGLAAYRLADCNDGIASQSAICRRPERASTSAWKRRELAWHPEWRMAVPFSLKTKVEASRERKTTHETSLQ